MKYSSNWKPEVMSNADDHGLERDMIISRVSGKVYKVEVALKQIAEYAKDLKKVAEKGNEKQIEQVMKQLEDIEKDVRAVLR